MSTRNHNILYFVVVSCTSLLNTGICLWKAQNGHVWRGFARSILHRNRSRPAKNPVPARFPYHPPRVALCRPPHKAQNWCRIPPRLCELWTKGGVNRPSLCAKPQTAMTWGASAGAGRGRCESLRTQSGRTQHASQSHTGAAPAESSRMSVLAVNSEPGARNRCPVLRYASVCTRPQVFVVYSAIESMSASARAET